MAKKSKKQTKIKVEWPGGPLEQVPWTLILEMAKISLDTDSLVRLVLSNSHFAGLLQNQASLWTCNFKTCIINQFPGEKSPFQRHLLAKAASSCWQSGRPSSVSTILFAPPTIWMDADHILCSPGGQVVFLNSTWRRTQFFVQVWQGCKLDCQGQFVSLPSGSLCKRSTFKLDKSNLVVSCGSNAALSWSLNDSAVNWTFQAPPDSHILDVDSSCLLVVMSNKLTLASLANNDTVEFQEFFDLESMKNDSLLNLSLLTPDLAIVPCHNYIGVWPRKEGMEVKLEIFYHSNNDGNNKSEEEELVDVQVCNENRTILVCTRKSNFYRVTLYCVEKNNCYFVKMSLARNVDDLCVELQGNTVMVGEKRRENMIMKSLTLYNSQQDVFFNLDKWLEFARSVHVKKCILVAENYLLMQITQKDGRANEELYIYDIFDCQQIIRPVENSFLVTSEEMQKLLVVPSVSRIFRVGPNHVDILSFV